MAESRHWLVQATIAVWLACVPALYAQFAEPNVNMVSGQTWPGGDPFLRQQNEPSFAISTRNPLHLLAGANDYRSVDIPFNAPPRPDQEETGDAWHGVFKSIDGGNHWTSTLLEGYPQDATSSSPLKGFQAGADPVVRAGDHGMFYYAGLVLNRGDNPLTGAFIARLIDNNNNEFGDPIAYIDTKLIVKGSPGQFIDKPWILVTNANNGAQCTVSGQTFPAQNVYLAYTVLVGGDINVRTKIYIARSGDCGATWGAPTKISESYLVNQGVQLGVDPTNPNNVYVVWRQFKDANGTDAIILAKSTNGGATFTKGTVVTTITPFEQKTSATSIRTNAYPAFAVDDAGRLHIAWSERDANGDGRIVLITSGDYGTTWSSPRQVDSSTGRGHQFMPAMTFAAGKLTLVWYDLRLDHTVGIYKKSVENPAFYDESRKAVGNLAAGASYDPGAVFWNFLADQSPTATPLVRRHTLDVRLAEFDPAAPVQTESVRASRYRFGTANWPAVSDTNIIHDMQINPPNLPMFRQGTVPFFGDYIDVHAYQNAPQTGALAVAPPPARVRHVVWTDNRDVRAPLGSPPDWTNYTPARSPALGTYSHFDPLQRTPDCTPDTPFVSSRNQNIYTTRVTDGLWAGSPGNAKTLGKIQRAFTVFVQNTRKTTAYYRLTIPVQPAGGEASFLQFEPKTELDVAIPPRSTATRSVFVENAVYAKVDVTIREISGVGGGEVTDGLVSAIEINPDPANPDIGTPDIGTPDIGTTEVFNPDIGTPDIGTPDIGTPDIGTPDIGTPDIGTPDIGTPDIGTPDIGTPDIGTPDIGTPNYSNPDIGTPDIGSSDMQNGSSTDTIWTATNKGNTTGGFTIRLLKTADFPAGVKSQLLLYKTYDTPVARGCDLSVEHNRQIVANVSNPALSTLEQIVDLDNSGLTDPSAKNPTMWLAPKETGKIAIRLVDPYHKGLVLDASQYVAPVVVAQAVNTADLGQPNPKPRMSLLITTTQINTGVVGWTYSTQFAAAGGIPPYSWNATATSPGLTMDSTGLLQGTFTTSDTTTVEVTVSDSATPPNTAKRTFIIPVADPLNYMYEPIASGMINSPMAQTMKTTGGLPPIRWTYMGGSLPNGLTLSSDGTISGTPTVTGNFTFSFRITDSSQPPQTLFSGRPMSLYVAPPPLGCSASVTTLFDNWNTSAVSNGGRATPLPDGFPSPTTRYCLDSIQTYHWNGGAGALPGTVAVRQYIPFPMGMTFTWGPWPAASSSGQGGAPNVNWIARPPVNLLYVLGSGSSYTVLDSDNATWSQNASSNGFGFARVLARVYTPPTLEFVTQPQSVISGDVIENDLTVVARDATGAVLPGLTVTVEPAAQCADITARTLTAVTDVTGQAHFGTFTANRAVYNCFFIARTMWASPHGDVSSSSTVFDIDGFGNFPANIEQRYTPASVRLNDGRVLVTGGTVNGSASATAEVYDSGQCCSWSSVGNMIYARTEHTATLLADGRVLIAGGRSSNTAWVTRLEIFDPATNTFSDTGLDLAYSRSAHSGTLLPNGTVLLIGGYGPGNTARGVVETYSPSAGLSQLTSSLAVPRWDHASVLIGDRVFVFGGSLGSTNVEIVDATSVTPGGNLNEVRSKLTATLLQDGKVLAAGGTAVVGGAFVVSSTTEVYDPVTHTSQFSAPLLTTHSGHAAQRLGDGSVVIAGGTGMTAGNVYVQDAVELYSPATQAGPASVTSYGKLFAPQYQINAIPLPSSGWPVSFIIIPSVGAGQGFYPPR